MSSRPDATRVRLDKWLWAARFYKTRSLAKTAVDGGKVHLNGARTKPAKEVVAGDRLTVTRGIVEQTVIIVGLSARRGSAAVAATLYEETPESVDARERLRAERRMRAAGLTVPKSRPNKKQRRALRDLKTNA
ncbi:MAG: S4 domain-containing protein [Gammaproteobacteria bacterium]|nr:S4 domain-containing protein [Gammaproteobacteria bacterium]